MNDSTVGLQRDNNGSRRLGGITGKGFKPGQSGNPAGKRKGTVSLASALARNITRHDANTICRKLIDMAIEGDVHAIKLLFEKLDDAQILSRLAELEAELQKRQ
jgi:hypothetical protein